LIAHKVTSDNADKVKTAIMRDFGALNVIDNTKAIPVEDAIAGDLIMSKWSTTLGHTRIIHSVAPPENAGDDYKITWYQGTLPPIVPIKKTSSFKDINGVFGKTPRRWKFDQFNET